MLSDLHKDHHKEGLARLHSIYSLTLYLFYATLRPIHIPVEEHMTEVRIRNVDDWVVESLRQQARLKGQSLEGSMRDLLAQEAMRPRRELAIKLHEMREELRKKYGTFSDSAVLIREDRDERG
jgi:plasmid stability protein